MEGNKMTWEELIMKSNKEFGYCLYDENFLPYLYKEIDDDTSLLFYKNTGNVRYRIENEKSSADIIIAEHRTPEQMYKIMEALK